MVRFRILGFRFFAIAVGVSIFAASSCGLLGEQSPATDQASGSTQDQFRLKVSSDLVIVRVVVRNAQGAPVQGLRKGDFKLFDRGKEQTISQFEVVAPDAPGATNNSSGQTSP